MNDYLCHYRKNKLKIGGGGGELKIPFMACSFLQEDLIFLSPLVVRFSGLDFAHVSSGFSGLKKTPYLFSLFLASQDL